MAKHRMDSPVESLGQLLRLWYLILCIMMVVYFIINAKPEFVEAIIGIVVLGTVSVWVCVLLVKRKYPLIFFIVATILTFAFGILVEEPLWMGLWCWLLG